MFTKQNLPKVLAVAAALGGAYYGHKHKKSLIMTAVIAVGAGLAVGFVANKVLPTA